MASTTTVKFEIPGLIEAIDRLTAAIAGGAGAQAAAVEQLTPAGIQAGTQAPIIPYAPAPAPQLQIAAPVQQQMPAAVPQFTQQAAPAPITAPPINYAPVQQMPQTTPQAQQQAPTYPPVIAQPAPQPQQQPVAGMSYTLDQISAAAGPLMDAGRMAELIALLGKYGVQATTQLKPEMYGAFATDLRAMGAQI